VKRVLMCGDRNWKDASLIDSCLMSLVYDIAVNGGGPLVIIAGVAKGADSIAEDRARYHNIELDLYPAQWHLYGRAAGPRRNQQMLDEGQPGLVVAFHDDLENSKGTADMVRRAKKAGVPVIHVSHKNPGGDRLTN